MIRDSSSKTERSSSQKSQTPPAEPIRGDCSTGRSYVQGRPAEGPRIVRDPLPSQWSAISHSQSGDRSATSRRSERSPAGHADNVRHAASSRRGSRRRPQGRRGAFEGTRPAEFPSRRSGRGGRCGPGSRSTGRLVEHPACEVRKGHPRPAAANIDSRRSTSRGRRRRILRPAGRLPRFERSAKSWPIELAIALLQLGSDPSSVLARTRHGRAGVNHLREGRVDQSRRALCGAS